jgi:surface protein
MSLRPPSSAIVHGPQRPNRLTAVLATGVEAKQNTPRAQTAADQQPHHVIPPPQSVSELPDDLRGEILKWSTDPYRDCKAIGDMCSLSKAFSEWCRNGRGEDFWHWVCKPLEWDRDDRLWTVWTWDASAKHWNTSETQPWRKQYQAWCNRQLDDVTIRQALVDVRDNDPTFAMHSFYGHIGCWDTSKVTDMEGLFFEASTFNQNISLWNTASVTDMSSMFYGASTFNQDISLWNTSRVTKMANMFRKATLFNQNISRWDTSSVRRWAAMFLQADSMQDVNKPRMGV